MDVASLERAGECEWRLKRTGAMRVPVVFYATEELMRSMDYKAREQAINVATLPGIVKASFVMPDGHWGYGFPVGGVAAFDAAQGGVISAGGVGFDISCGVRLLVTGLHTDQVSARKGALADALFRTVPAGPGSTGQVRLETHEMDEMLRGGGAWAVARGYGVPQDLERTEEHGCMAGARPECVSPKAKARQRAETGTLGSGNHYLEVQTVTLVYDRSTADAFGLEEGAVVVSIHCGSRGLGHQIGTDYLARMLEEAPSYGITLPDRELACAPLRSPLGESYLGAMRAGINCALANRQIITHLTRQVFGRMFPGSRLALVYDVSHNTCKEEVHRVGSSLRPLFVHRKGATRAFPPLDPSLPPPLSAFGQPVLVGGTMGTASYVLAGTERSEKLAFASACHGAGRALSRNEASRRWSGRELLRALEERGIFVRSPSLRGVAEEAPAAYKDVTAVVEAADRAGLARLVARLEPMVCIKG
jgi:tRNA-splicing ligase RtcB